MNDRRHTAIHEAGHAVIGRAVTMECGSASITADEDSAGHSITSDPWAVAARWKEREKWRDIVSAYRGRILTMMAGAESEDIILGECEGGDGDDRYQITLMLHDMADEADHGRIETRLWKFTRRHGADIERVAAALSERDLDGVQKAVVPRGEHEQQWAAKRVRDADLQRQTDQNRQGLYDLNTPRDTLQAMQRRIDELERGRRAVDR